MSASLAVALLFHGLAFTVGAVSLGIGLFLHLQHRTPVLRRFLLFLTTLFLFVLAFLLRTLTEVLYVLTDASSLAAWALQVSQTLYSLAFVSEMVGSVVHVLILPPMIYGLAGRVPPNAEKVSSVGIALLIATGGLYYALAARAAIPEIVLSALLFGTIAFYLGLLAYWFARARRAGDDALPPRIRKAARAVRGFLIVSIVFVPLFVLDIVGSMVGFLRAGSVLDNASVPVFFLIMCTGSMVVAHRFLNHPPLMEDEQVTDTAKTRYGLTDREAELVEFVLEGFTLPDAAGVMGIAAKTAENHLYSVYRKTGVTNRIQLFGLFNDNRRS